MGKYFAVAVLDNGCRGTIWYDETPEVGSEVTIYHYDSIGVLVSEIGKLVELK